MRAIVPVHEMRAMRERFGEWPHLSECWLVDRPDDEDACCTCRDSYPDCDSE